ncbi:hypothetical protein PUN28_020767 [Cardiocondyla obscurior]|uniref:Uncharacterized protein n=1 Tax=Cardiocondyla obscurior TaxID=286306 RepID=A0AAW2E6C3_9HYME
MLKHQYCNNILVTFRNVSEMLQYCKVIFLQCSCNLKCYMGLQHFQHMNLKYRHLISQHAINDLLQILRVPYPKFPVDSRSFLKTPNSCLYEIINMLPGFYCHIGIENTIRRFINENINLQNFLF